MSLSSSDRFYSVLMISYAGVWDVMSNIEVVEFVRKKIASNMKPPAVSLRVSRAPFTTSPLTVLTIYYIVTE